MYFAFLALLIGLLLLVVQKPFYGTLTTLIIISLGPAIDPSVGSNIKFGVIAAIFLVVATNALRHYKVSIYAIVFMVLALVKEIIGYTLGFTMQSFMLSIYVYVVIFGIAYFNFLDIKARGINFWDQYQIYIIICLAIQFYRAIFDFSFFGLATMKGDGMYQELYEYGGELFRPSSLQGCIVYAIELGVFIGITILKEGINKKNSIILIVATIGLLLTYSRSGLLIFFISVIFYLVRSRKTSFLPIALIAFVVYLLANIGYSDRLNESLDFGSETYQTRFTSIATVLGKISSFNFFECIFGVGYGMANYIGENGLIAYYVENYYLSLIINSGFVTLILMIFYSIYIIFEGRKKKLSDTVVFVALLIVNFLACSLLTYSVQILFWMLSLSILYDGHSPLAVKTHKLKRSALHRL